MTPRPRRPRPADLSPLAALGSPAPVTGNTRITRTRRQITEDTLLHCAGPGGVREQEAHDSERRWGKIIGEVWGRCPR